MSKSEIRDAAIGAVVLIVLSVLVLAGVGMVSKPAEPSPTSRAAPPRQPAVVQRKVEKPRPGTTSAIVASIQDFQNGIPLLERDGFNRQQEPNGIEYRWQSTNDASWIKLYDYGSNGRLNRVSAVFDVDTKKKNAALMAVALAFRLVQVASGLTTLDAGDFSTWVSGNLKLGEAVTKRFGKTRVRIQATAVGKHPGMSLVIE